MLRDDLRGPVIKFLSKDSVRVLVAVYFVTDGLERFLYDFTRLVYFPSRLITYQDLVETSLYALLLAIGIYMAYRLITRSGTDHTRIVCAYLFLRALALFPGLLQSTYSILSGQTDLYPTGALFLFLRIMVFGVLLMISSIKMWKKQFDKTFYLLLSSAAFVYVSTANVLFSYVYRLPVERLFGPLVEGSEIFGYLAMGIVFLAIALGRETGILSFSPSKAIGWTGGGVFMFGLDQMSSWVLRYLIRFSEFVDTSSWFSFNNFFYFYRYILPALKGVRAVTVITIALFVYTFATGLRKTTSPHNLPIGH